MKKSIALLLAGLLLCAQAGALAQVHKDEIVYARLSARGEPQAVYVVNAFEADAPEQVVDYGAYQQVLNLTDAAPLSVADGAVQLSLHQGRFFYQGNLQEAALPWDIRLDWQLDGKPVEDPRTLSGATGALAITLTVTPKEDMRAVAGGLTLQATLPLDADRASNVQAPKATLAWAAGDLTATYALLPGMPASYTITADVRNFSMGSIQLAGVRMGMDADMYRLMAEERLQDTPLAGAAGNMMENFIGGMTAEKQPSFADSRNGDIRSLQFVLLTEEIPPAEPHAEEAPMTGEAEGGFFQRLLKLFGG